MPSGQLRGLLQQIRRFVGTEPAGTTPDAQLLEEFRLHQDQAAFTALVQRYGPLVLGLCRRVLLDPDDADDAFQATFLVLAKKAGSIRRPESLSSWLYGVALRVAGRVRAQNLQRRTHEKPVTAMSARPHLGDNESTKELAAAHTDPSNESARRELRFLLDEELSRLPEKYRLPMILCYLEGKSNEEAARQLHWTKGTVSGRLARARDLLRGRLARRGMVLSAVGLAAVLAENFATAAVPPSLVSTTVQNALQFTAGRVAFGAGATKVSALARGTLRAMTGAKVKAATTIFALLAVTGSGAGVLAYRTLGGHRPTARSRRRAADAFHASGAAGFSRPR